MLEVVFSKHAQKFIKKHKANTSLIKKLASSINKLRAEPIPASAKKLVGYPFYRIRVQDYRIVYKFDSTDLNIVIIEKRDKVYGLLRKH